MKQHLKYVLILLVLLISFSCNEAFKGVSLANLEIENKLVYYSNSDNLYTGAVYDSFVNTNLVRVSGNYLDGKPHGMFRWYNENGDKIQESKLENGKLISKKVFQNGEVLMETNFDESILNKLVVDTLSTKNKHLVTPLLDEIVSDGFLTIDKYASAMLYDIVGVIGTNNICEAIDSCYGACVAYEISDYKEIVLGDFIQIKIKAPIRFERTESILHMSFILNEGNLGVMSFGLDTIELNLFEGNVDYERIVSIVKSSNASAIVNEIKSTLADFSEVQFKNKQSIISEETLQMPVNIAIDTYLGHTLNVINNEVLFYAYYEIIDVTTKRNKGIATLKYVFDDTTPRLYSVNYKLNRRKLKF